MSMGPLGLLATAVGVVLFLWGQRTIAGSIRDLPEALARLADERLGRLDCAAIVVAVAVVIFLATRQLGHGRVGLYVCVALLMINAAVVAALRVRWLEALRVEPAIAARHRRGALVQMVGAWICFAGCAIYLLRP
jgi:hypothetical protein